MKKQYGCIVSVSLFILALIVGMFLIPVGKVFAQGAINGTQAVVSEKNITSYDCSGTITAGGSAQSLLPITGATPTKSPNVRGFMIMNVDTTAENLCVNFNGTVGAATCASTGYYALQAATATAAGGSYSSQLGFGPGNNPTIVAATTGHKFTCTYW